MCVPLTSPTEVDGQVGLDTGFALESRVSCQMCASEGPSPVCLILAVICCLRGRGGRRWFPGTAGDEKRGTSAWQSSLH